MAPLVIAHRGDSAHRPENTLASFASALEVGAEIVELDVQLTRDGHVVVLHDPTLDRTTSGCGPVRELELVQVRRFSAGYPDRFGQSYRGERVPTLTEALAFLRGRARVMVEIKKDSVTDDDTEGIEARTLTEIKKMAMESDVVILSFDPRALLRCRDQAPEVSRGHLFYRAEATEVLAGARDAVCEIVMPEKGMLSEELRERVREVGLRLGTWVVDEPDELRRLAPYDLYGVGTNRPGVLLEALADLPGSPSR